MLQIPLALSDIGPTADGTSVGHLKLSLQSTTLPSAMPVARYTQLQSLLLSNNCLKDLKVRGRPAGRWTIPWLWAQRLC
jgi:hypothetical protein